MSLEFDAWWKNYIGDNTPSHALQHGQMGCAKAAWNAALQHATDKLNEEEDDVK